MTTADTKYKLQEQCSNLIAIRLENIQKTIKELELSIKEESKSTSGDKHHTGRAMLQIEREKAGNQLMEIEKVMRQLDRVNVENTTDIAHLGSIVTTNQAVFFLSISVGKLEINKKNYLAIAPNSPIGLNLIGKKVGDQFNFKSNIYKIIAIE